MSTGWNKEQTGWVYDDLFEDGYRFNNENLRVWVCIPKELAANSDNAHEYLVQNLDKLELNPHT